MGTMLEQLVPRKINADSEGVGVAAPSTKPLEAAMPSVTTDSEIANQKQSPFCVLVERIFQHECHIYSEIRIGMATGRGGDGFRYPIPIPA